MNYDIIIKVIWTIFWRLQRNQQGSFQRTASLAFFEAKTQSNGKNILLVFEKGMQQLLKQAKDTSYKDDALIFSKAAKIVQKYVQFKWFSI